MLLSQPLMEEIREIAISKGVDLDKIQEEIERAALEYGVDAESIASSLVMAINWHGPLQPIQEVR